MRMSRDEKARSHSRIVFSAARRLRAHGIEGTSVADMMSDADLTHGGFYRHFTSKDALVRAALDAAFDEMLAQVARTFELSVPGEAVADVKSFYLARAHVGNAESGCPIAALAGDVCRQSDAVRETFTAGVERMLRALAAGMDGTPAQRRKAAARELATMVGAVMIARASDAPTSHDVLRACRATADR
jgi:TetR/AcrR family transcriptional repressor of nem operon